jgi:tetratricopeptide (TPR) repeat protein
MDLKPVIFFLLCFMLIRGQLFGNNILSNQSQISSLGLVSFLELDSEIQQPTLINTSDHRMTGLAAFHQGRFADAAQQFELVLERDNDWLVRQLLGLSYYELGQTEEALNQWFAAEPKFAARALVHKALSANRANEPLSAKLHAETALRLDPFLGEAYLELGRAQATQDKWEIALVNYERAARLITDKYKLSSLYRSMATLYSHTGDRESAVAILEKAISVTPDVYLGYLQLASAYWDMGRTDDAIATLETAISLEPRNVQAYLSMGDLYRDLDLLEEALRWYQQAKQIDPNSGRADYATGALLLRISQPDESIRYLEKAVALGWQPYWVLFDLGSAYEQTGQQDAAAAAYRQVTQMTDIPETALLSAWLKLAQLYTNMAEEGQANEAWLRVLALEPQHPAIPQFIRGEQ